MASEASGEEPVPAGGAQRLWRRLLGPRVRLELYLAVLFLLLAFNFENWLPKYIPFCFVLAAVCFVCWLWRVATIKPDA